MPKCCRTSDLTPASTLRPLRPFAIYATRIASLSACTQRARLTQKLPPCVSPIDLA